MLLAPLLTLLMGSLGTSTSQIGLGLPSRDKLKSTTACPVLAAPASDLELGHHGTLDARAAVPVIGDLRCKELAGGALDKRVCVGMTSGLDNRRYFRPADGHLRL